MARAPSNLPVKLSLLQALKAVPPGRVTTFETLGASLGAAPRLIVSLLDGLSEDERQIVPWHRVVAKGGAIGRGPHRESQFARLVREGVMMSPAGIVQDLARTAVTSFDTAKAGSRDQAPNTVPPPQAVAGDAPPPSRSRGMLRHR
jgi:methylated-DNA-protein-cysteine methyltransferase-like protein